MENIQVSGANLHPKEITDNTNAIAEEKKKKAKLVQISEMDPQSPELEEVLKGGYSEMGTQVAKAVKAGLPKEDIKGVIDTQTVFDETDASDLNTLMIKNHTSILLATKTIASALFGLNGYMASGWLGKEALDLTMSGKTDIEKQEILNKERDNYKNSESNVVDSFAEGLLGQDIGVNSELIRERSEADTAIATNEKNISEELVTQSDEYKQYVLENGEQMAQNVYLPYLQKKMKKNYSKYLDSATNLINEKIEKDTKMLEEKYKDISGISDEDDILGPIVRYIEAKQYKKEDGTPYTDEEILETAKYSWMIRRYLPENWEGYTPTKSTVENGFNIAGSLAGLLVNTIGLSKTAGSLGVGASGLKVVKALAKIRNGRVLKYAPNVPNWIHGYAGYEGVKAYESQINLGKSTGVATLAGIEEYAKIAGINYVLYGVIAPRVGHAILSSKLHHYVYSSTKLGQSSQLVSKLSKFSKYNTEDAVKFGAKVLSGSALMGVENIGLNLMNPNALWDDEIEMSMLIGGTMSAVGLMNDDFSHNIGRVWANKGGIEPSAELMNIFKDRKWSVIADMVKQDADISRAKYLLSKYAPEVELNIAKTIPKKMFMTQRKDKDSYKIILNSVFTDSPAYKKFEKIPTEKANRSFELIEFGKTLELYQKSNQINKIEGGVADDIINRAKRVGNGEDIDEVNYQETMKTLNLL